MRAATTPENSRVIQRKDAATVQGTTAHGALAVQLESQPKLKLFSTGLKTWEDSLHMENNRKVKILADSL